MARTIDLTKMTPEAVKSNVLSGLLTSPLTVWPMFGAGAVFAYWFIFEAAWFFMLIGGFSFFFGIAYFLFNFFLRYDVLSNKYFSKLREENEQEARETLQAIQHYLDNYDYGQGAEQVEKLQRKMESFEEVLKSRFEEGEMAFARYHKVAEQVFLNAIDNLQNMVVQLKAVQSIDIDYIRRRWEELERITDENDGLDDSQWQESETLKERYELWEKHDKAVDDLLTLNEKAMTELDKFASRVATAKTDGRDVEADLEHAMENLTKLSDEAEKHWG